MTFELPKLPYASNALEPHISEQTINFHYGKHHQAYINNLNNLVKDTEFENADLETIIKKSNGGIFNNAAQIWNHTFYFMAFAAQPKTEPGGKLAEMINSEFGSLQEFKEKFNKAAATLFGSGWAWLVLNKENKLEIVQTSNAENPMTNGYRPLLTCDVWEHAYYLDTQNKRPDYISNFWNILDWKVIEERL